MPRIRKNKSVPFSVPFSLAACAQNACRSAQQFTLKHGLNSYQGLISKCNNQGKRVKVEPLVPLVEMVSSS